MFTNVTIFEFIPPFALQNLNHSFSDDERCSLCKCNKTPDD